MNYKVGEKVRVKQDLEEGERYGDTLFIKRMNDYKIVTISGILKPNNYKIIEDGGRDYYSNEMLEPLHREIKDIQYGDVITNGEKFVYILDRHNEVVIRGWIEDTVKEAKDACWAENHSLKEFIVKFKDWKIVGQESEDVEIIVDGKTTTISRKSAKALNLLK